MLENFDILIIGGGVNGLVTALFIVEKSHLRVAIIDKQFKTLAEKYSNAWALSKSSLELLKKCGVCVEGFSAPIQKVGVDTKIREDFALTFEDVELGRNTNSSLLKATLLLKAQEHPSIELIEAELENITINNNEVEIKTTAGRIKGDFLIGADGRFSSVRKLLNIHAKEHAFHQTAFTTVVQHEEKHRHLALEYFLKHGPIALIPYPDEEQKTSTLVWSLENEEAKTFNSYPTAEQEYIVSSLLSPLFGALRFLAPLKQFPLSAWEAQKKVGMRWTLVGDAAQNMHPVAGQGLNLGLRDAAQLAETITQNHTLGLPYWDELYLKAYAKRRVLDTKLFTKGTSVLVDFYRWAPGFARTASAIGMRFLDTDLFNLKDLLKRLASRSNSH